MWFLIAIVFNLETRMKVKIVILLVVVAVCTAVPFERELTLNAHAIPEYALKRAAQEEQQKRTSDTSDLKTDSSLWWSTGYLYPYTYSKFYTPSYNRDTYYPYYTFY